MYSKEQFEAVLRKREDAYKREVEALKLAMRLMGEEYGEEDARREAAPPVSNGTVVADLDVDEDSEDASISGEIERVIESLDWSVTFNSHTIIGELKKRGVPLPPDSQKLKRTVGNALWRFAKRKVIRTVAKGVGRKPSRYKKNAPTFESSPSVAWGEGVTTAEK
jgi:hypothetical protein